jgi:hypothetical protein
MGYLIIGFIVIVVIAVAAVLVYRNNRAKADAVIDGAKKIVEDVKK